MNLISNIKVSSLPYFPELTGLKTTRVITKHFTNCAMYMLPAQFSLLTWLIYQSKSDNTIVYSTHLLTKFKESRDAASKVYVYTNESARNIAIKVIRCHFKHLVETGYLLPNYNKKVFTINPMLSYRSEYMSAANYKYFVSGYNHVQSNSKIILKNGESMYNDKDLLERCLILTKNYSESINSVIKKKIVK